MVALPPRSGGLVVVESLTSALLVLSAILGNSLLLVSLYRKPRLKSSTGSLIAALAMTDLLNACIPGVLFWSSLTTGKMSLGNFGCQISGFFMHFLTYVSIATMALTAVNRYVCVLKPNVYRKAFSYNRSMLCIASLWAFNCSSGCLSSYSVRFLHLCFQPRHGFVYNEIYHRKHRGWLHVLHRGFFCGFVLDNHIGVLLSRVPIHPPSQREHHLAAVDARDQLDKGVVCSCVYICGIMDTGFLDDCPDPSRVEGETSPSVRSGRALSHLFEQRFKSVDIWCHVSSCS